MDLTFIRKDSVKVGIVLGILIPLLAIYIQYLYNYGHYSFGDFINILKTNKRILTGVSTIALIVNGFLFGILIQFKKYETARGLFIPTVVYGIAVLIYKLL